MKNIKKAFTLAELLTAISIISIIAIASTNINFNTINHKQEYDNKLNKIIVNYEEVRNNSLLGKGIGTDLQTPDFWSIKFDKIGSGTVVTSHFNPKTEYKKYDFVDTLSLEEINLLSFSGIVLESDLDNAELIFDGSNISLSGSTSKILNLKTKYRNNFQKEININTINGLIEIKKY